jgi:SAM-dependent methyltransferase
MGLDHLQGPCEAATGTLERLTPELLQCARGLCPCRQNPLPGGRRITYEHGLAEATRYPDASWDMVAFQFIAHECPQAALHAFVQEARRILKPGGVMVFVDK